MAKNKTPNLASVTTINEDGSHYALHPADVRGKFTMWRRVTAYLILSIYILLPWIKINGFPAVFLDTASRQFYLFGLTLAVQDLWVLFFLISGLGFTLFFVTSLLGRIWCGWTCPYTIFLEHVFRRIERLVDGDSQARKRLDTAPWSAAKLIKRLVKHSLYILCATLIAHIFISYFVSLERLYGFIQEGPANHRISFGAIAFLTLVLYFCFAWFREQFCIVMCPYGRIQSALSDDNTMVIGYDHSRGEPRGKAADPGNGDCIDCHRCIHVCPTGIDIRNGLQLECIGCAACIDACDDIMKKLDRPTGLVRYSSHNVLEGKKQRIIRPRIFAYCILMLLGVTAFGFTAYKKARPFTAQVNKFPGDPFQRDIHGVRNIYQLHLFNKRNQPVSYKVKFTEAPTWLIAKGQTDNISLAAQESKTVNLIAEAPAEHYHGEFTFNINVTSELDGSSIDNDVRFLGPSPALYRNFLDKNKKP